MWPPRGGAARAKLKARMVVEKHLGPLGQKGAKEEAKQAARQEEHRKMVHDGGPHFQANCPHRMHSRLIRRAGVWGLHQTHELRAS